MITEDSRLGSDLKMGMERVLIKFKCWWRINWRVTEALDERNGRSNEDEEEEGCAKVRWEGIVKEHHRLTGQK